MLNCTPCWIEKKILLLLNAQLYTMFDVRYPTTTTCPNMGLWVGLALSSPELPNEARRESGSQSPELHGRMLRP